MHELNRHGDGAPDRYESSAQERAREIAADHAESYRALYGPALVAACALWLDAQHPHRDADLDTAALDVLKGEFWTIDVMRQLWREFIGVPNTQGKLALEHCIAFAPARQRLVPVVIARRMRVSPVSGAVAAILAATPAVLTWAERQRVAA